MPGGAWVGGVNARGLAGSVAAGPGVGAVGLSFVVAGNVAGAVVVDFTVVDFGVADGVVVVGAPRAIARAASTVHGVMPPRLARRTALASRSRAIRCEGSRARMPCIRTAPGGRSR